jgi:hypothetical protein
MVRRKGEHEEKEMEKRSRYGKRRFFKTMDMHVTWL